MDFQSALTEKVPCENCSGSTSPGQTFCPSCGYPQNGTTEQKEKFKDSIRIHQVLASESKKETRTARNIIFALAGLYFCFALYYGFGLDDFDSMIGALFFCLLFLVLGAWANRNPFGAILTAFIVYVTFILVELVIDPSSIVKGIILKVFIIAAFVKGIRSANEAQKYTKELEKMKASHADA